MLSNNGTQIHWLSWIRGHVVQKTCLMISDRWSRLYSSYQLFSAEPNYSAVRSNAICELMLIDEFCWLAYHNSEYINATKFYSWYQRRLAEALDVYNGSIKERVVAKSLFLLFIQAQNQNHSHQKLLHVASSITRVTSAGSSRRSKSKHSVHTSSQCGNCTRVVPKPQPLDMTLFSRRWKLALLPHPCSLENVGRVWLSDGLILQYGTLVFTECLAS